MNEKELNAIEFLKELHELEKKYGLYLKSNPVCDGYYSEIDLEDVDGNTIHSDIEQELLNKRK